MLILPNILSFPKLAEIFTFIIELLSQLMSFFLNLLDPFQTLISKDLELITDLLWIYLPWIILVGLIKLLLVLIVGARKRKTGVVILATILQMLMPDPYVDRTIKTVQVQTKKQADSSEDPSGEEIDKKSNWSDFSSKK